MRVFAILTLLIIAGLLLAALGNIDLPTVRGQSMSSPQGSDTVQDGTDIVGVIRQNSTWTAAGSPYNIIEYVQIAPSVTLTIEAGVEVKGIDPDQISRIETYGQLFVLGTSSAPVRISGIFLHDLRDNYPGQGPIYISNAEVSTGEADYEFNFWLSSTGEWQVEDSVFIGKIFGRDRFLGHCGSGNCQIRDTTFAGMRVELEDVDSLNTTFYEGSWIGSIGGQHRGNIYSGARVGFSGQATVENNLFQNASELGLSVPTGSPDDLVFQHNSLLGFAHRTVSVGTSSSPALPTNVDLTNNFWGTLDTDEIDNIIYDANDSVNGHTFAIYQPLLAEAHPDTPDSVPTPPSLTTATPTATISPTPTATPDLIATETAISEHVATSVAATLTAIAHQAPEATMTTQSINLPLIRAEPTARFQPIPITPIYITPIFITPIPIPTVHVTLVAPFPE
ncbi:MAG: hypothetical protein IT328_20220 [Caldilineaceae bacterium]|nr:hypothetical protein [Caldilineaceae bacterium]